MMQNNNFRLLLLLARLINAKLRCFAVSVSAVHSDSTVSVVGFEGQSKRWWAT